MCAEPILINAKVCRNCNAFQDWRAWLSTSQATLALIVALVSVIGTAGPSILNAIKDDNSQLTGSFQAFVDRRALFIVANTGTRPGSISDAKIFITSDNQNVGGASVYIELLALKPSDHFIPQTSSSALLFAPADKSWEMVSRTFTNPDLPPRICSLHLKLIEFDGEVKRVAAPQSCRKLFYGFWGERGTELSNKYLPPEA